MLSYNVLTNGLFDAFRGPPMSRLIQAIAPDIIGFQEIYDYGSLEVAAKIESILPSGPNEQWYHAKEGPDIITISKYPIIESFPIDNNGAFLLDLEAVTGGQLLFINAHTPCCGNNTERQLEIDAIMAFIRNSKNGIGPLQLEENTPIVIVGDMNLVGYSQQLKTLLTGDIVNNDFYGPEFEPDWDGSELEDSRPFTTDSPDNFTWFREQSSFGPGRLDFIVYTGSVMELMNNYTLFTRKLPQDSLDTFNLFEEDAIIASDHLPVVSDFYLDDLNSLKNNTNLKNSILLQQNEPNPFHSKTTIKYFLAQNGEIDLSVYNVMGQKMATIANEFNLRGNHHLEFDASNLEAGIYFLKLHANSQTSSIKMTIVH